MSNIICFGEILWDAFGDEKVAGGAPMNVARHLAQQGADVLFATRIGTDEPGKGLLGFLKANGLYSDLVQEDTELPTCEVTVQLDAEGHATYVFPESVSWDNIQPALLLDDAAEQAPAIVYGTLACRKSTTLGTLLDLLPKTNALKIFDVNLRPPYYTVLTIENLAEEADVIKMNDDEAILLSKTGSSDLREIMLEFQQKYELKAICITRGSNGAIAWQNGAFYEHPGYKVHVVDTVGAGDSFLATFINGLLKQQPMPEILDKACKVGAFVAGKRGANPEYDADLKQLF